MPLMRKEKIEKLPSSSVESQDLDQPYDDGLHSPLTNPSVSENDPLALAVTSVSMVTSATSQSSSSVTASSKCKTEVVDESEPPRKRGR